MLNLKFNPFAIPPIITAIILLLVSIIAFKKSRLPKVKTTFSLFCLSMIVWLFGFIFMYLCPNEINALKWARIGFIGITFIPIFAYHFILSFINSKRRFLLILLYLSAVPTIILSRTDLVYSGIESYFWGYYPTAGKLYFVFMLIFFGVFTWGVILLLLELIKSRKNNEPIRTQQIKYVLLAFAFGTTGVIDYIVKYRVSFYPYGYLSALAFISLIAYAIAQYRLMDINLVFRGGLIFFPYFFSIYAASIVIILFVNHNYWLTILFVGFLLAAAPFLRDYIRSKITGVVDSVIFRDKYKYQNRLLNSIDTMILITKESDLIRNTLKTLIESFYIKKAAIFTFDHMFGSYNNRIQFGLDEISEHRIQNNSYIVAWLKEHKEVFVLEEEEKRMPTDKIENIKKELGPLQAKVCIPVYFEPDLEGIITLDNKSTGDMYTHIDTELLKRLGIQLAVALDYKRLEAELRKKQEYAAVGQLAFEITHEMKNLMVPINTFMELVPERLNNKEFMDGFRLTAITNLRAMNKKVEDVLFFGQEQKPMFEPGLDINSILEHTIKSLIILAENKHIPIIRELSNIPKIMADKRLMIHVFNNLIINAIDAMEEKTGNIIVRSSITPNINGQMRQTSSEWVRIEVKDDGEGIPDRVKEKMFMAFVTTKSGGGDLQKRGMGLGLAVVKKVIDAHNGVIGVNTKVGKGTTFVIDLPVEQKI